MSKENEITFYKVPLVCKAAPEIGCGPRAIPVILELEKSPLVKEVWFNRPGTVIAVVWRDDYAAEQKASTAADVFKANKMDVSQISGKEYKVLLSDFVKNKRENWYQGDAVTKLSIEEAGIIAERMVGRIHAKTPLNGNLKETLQDEFTNVFKEDLLALYKTYGSEVNTNEGKVVEEIEIRIEPELKGIAEKYHLNEKEIAALDEAFSQEFGSIKAFFND